MGWPITRVATRWGIRLTCRTRFFEHVELRNRKAKSLQESFAREGFTAAVSMETEGGIAIAASIADNALRSSAAIGNAHTLFSVNEATVVPVIAKPTAPHTMVVRMARRRDDGPGQQTSEYLFMGKRLR